MTPVRASRSIGAYQVTILPMNTDLSIDKFEPTQAQLSKLAEDAQDALTLDLSDKTQLDLFKSRKKSLQQARLDITRTGKSLREEANQFAKSVIAKEKEYLAVITPIEGQLDEKMNAFKQAAIREERMAELPERKKMLEEMQCTDTTDDELLDMDHDKFVAFLNEKKAEHLDRMMAEQREREAEARRAEELKAAEQRAAQEAEERAKREAEAKLAEEQAAREKAERELQEEKDRQERERVEAEERAKREAEEKAEAERKAKEEEEARKKKEAEDEKYQAWLDKNGVNDETIGSKYVLKDIPGGEVRLYKLIDTFTFE